MWLTPSEKTEIHRKRKTYEVEIRKNKHEQAPTKKRLDSPIPSDESCEDLLAIKDDMVVGVGSHDPSLQLKATTEFRKILSTDPSHIDSVVQSGVVPHFVEFLSKKDNPTLQFEAAWALAHIASGTSEHTQVVIDHGAVPILVELLDSPNDHVREKAIWGLGCVARDSLNSRDLVLSYGAFMPMLHQLSDHSRLSILRTATWALSNIFFRPMPPLELLAIKDDMVVGVGSHDPSFQLEATTEFRKILSTDPSHIDSVVQSGVVPHFVEFLSKKDNPTLQFEAAWALAHIASGTSEHTQVVIDHGAVPLLVELLDSPNDHVREKAIWGLGCVARDSLNSRDLVLSYGAFMPMLHQLSDHSRLSILRTATWALSQFFRFRPMPPLELVKSIIIALQRLVHSKDKKVLTDACWAFENLSHGLNGNIESVIGAGVVPKLIGLLGHTSLSVQVPALRTIGNIVAGNNQQTQYVINCGVLPVLEDLLKQTDNKNLKKEACWAISNITAGFVGQIQSVIDANLIPTLVNLAQNANFDIKKEAVWAISNVAMGGSHGQIKCLVEQNSIKPLCDILACQDLRIILVSLYALESILQAGELEKNTGHVNCYTQLIGDVEGLEKIQNLQSHNSNEICEKATMILETYRLEEKDDGGLMEIVQPQVDEERDSTEVRLNEMDKEIIDSIWSDNEMTQIQAIAKFAKLLEGKKSSPLFIDDVKESAIVPRLIEILARTSDVLNVRQWVASVLGSFAFISIQCRDYVIKCGALKPLLARLHEDHWFMPEAPARALSILCSGNPAPPFHQMEPALSVLQEVLRKDDEEFLSACCWAIHYICVCAQGNNIQSVIEAGLVERLVELLQHPSRSVVVPALLTIKHTAWGDNQQKQSVIECGALPVLAELLTQIKSAENACLTISGITAGPEEQIQSVIDENLIPKLVNLARNAESGIQEASVLAITNATFECSQNQMKYLVEQECIETLCDLLESPSDKVIKMCLQGLKNLLRFEEAVKDMEVLQLIEDVGGLQKIENLQYSRNIEIYQKALKILETHWTEEDEEQTEENSTQVYDVVFQWFEEKYSTM